MPNHKVLRTALVLLISVSSCIDWSKIPAEDRIVIPARVIRVVDGDTVDVVTLNTDKLRFKKDKPVLPYTTNSVRLMLIDCMETRDNDRLERLLLRLYKEGMVRTKAEIMAEGERAKKVVTEMVPVGAAVELEFLTPTKCRDQYERLLAIVFINGTNLSLYLVQEGLATAYFVDPPRTKTYEYYSSQVKDAEEAAKKQRLGVWDLLQKQ